MESEREQLLYGDRCMHGTNIGTPSGADFLCNYCEDGMTEWHDDPIMEVRFSVDPMAYPTTLTTFLTSEWKQKWSILMREWLKPDCIWTGAEALALNPVFEVRTLHAGYWEYPSE